MNEIDERGRADCSVTELPTNEYVSSMRWTDCLVVECSIARSLANRHGNDVGWAECLAAECSVAESLANVYHDSMIWTGVRLIRSRILTSLQSH